MNEPSAEALKVAQIIHDHFDHQPETCITCLDTAKTIDAELQLPQRNAALLIAQTIVDAEANLTPLGLREMMNGLREALTRIKKS